MVVKKEIDNTKFMHTLKTNEVHVAKNDTSIRSFNHQLFTYVQDKNALTPYYDKMKMLDNINCEPFGYKFDPYI